MQEKLKKLIEESLKKLGIENSDFIIEHPEDFKNGDYSSNIALVLAKSLKTNPRELAQKITEAMSRLMSRLNLDIGVEKVEVAGAGFINFYLAREFFSGSIKEIINKGEEWGKNEISKGKKVMVEYTDPNPFKPFHIGHLMSNAIGESISRLQEYSGAEVIRANYQGDIGLHVAKTIYCLLKKPEEYIRGDETTSMQAFLIGVAYTEGAEAYESDEKAKEEINEINKKLYDKSDEKINKLYEWGKDITLKAFEEIYEVLGTKFKHYFFEKDMAPIGEKVVKENIGKVFEFSDGAVVFKAEKYDPKLHTRVFINSLGLPTYETKEIGLTITKFKKENPDLSIVITANEQGEYMKVVQKAIAEIYPDYESKMKHIVHGMMRFATGKMSSRKGNVITGESLLRDARIMVLEKMKDREFSEDEKEKIASMIAVSALKYSILRQSIGVDIIYDFDKSISFEGDSGPYLQYTAVRANSILKKAQAKGVCEGYRDIPKEVKEIERMLYKFPEVVKRAYLEFGPHHVATYLTELASSFNSFYGSTQIVNKNDPYSPYLVSITEAFYLTTKSGLYLLGIKTPEKM